MGSDGYPALANCATPRFNSRSRVGSDNGVIGAHPHKRRFNSRSRVGSDSATPRIFLPTRCFNSRSRVGSDLVYREGTDQQPVSIRAPAWGATLKQEGLGIKNVEFQFALPRGERHRHPARNTRLRSFNSRSRVGSDVMSMAQPKSARVSIRAPAWGATDQLAEIADDGTFQFALPRGERLPPPIANSSGGRFQFALPRGERQASTASPPTSAVFQFALPRGERPGGQF